MSRFSLLQNDINSLNDITLMYSVHISQIGYPTAAERDNRRVLNNNILRRKGNAS